MSGRWPFVVDRDKKRKSSQVIALFLSFGLCLCDINTLGAYAVQSALTLGLCLTDSLLLSLHKSLSRSWGGESFAQSSALLWRNTVSSQSKMRNIWLSFLQQRSSPCFSFAFTVWSPRCWRACVPIMITELFIRWHKCSVRSASVAHCPCFPLWCYIKAETESGENNEE